MNLFKRDWELIDKTITESQAEHAIKLGIRGYISEYLLGRKIIYIFKCKLTGKIKQKVITF